VSLNTVTRYRQELGLKAVLAVKQVNDALEKHPHPEIFNTDQGAQCTSEIHTQRNPSIICKTYKTAHFLLKNSSNSLSPKNL
jgi:hypothetical protein